MDATQSTERRSAAGTWTIALVVLLLLCASALVTACGGSSTTASNSPSATITSPSASPSMVPAAEPVSQWDAPGSASLAQTKAVGKKGAALLVGERIPGAGLYAKDATFDYWASGDPRTGRRCDRERLQGRRRHSSTGAKTRPDGRAGGGRPATAC